MDLPHHLRIHRLFLREKQAGNLAAYLKRPLSDCVHFFIATTFALPAYRPFRIKAPAAMART